LPGITGQDFETEVSIGELLGIRPFVWCLVIQSVPFVLIQFVFTCTLPYLSLVLKLPDMALECVFLFYKVPFLLSCVLTPALMKSSKFLKTNLLTAGYLLSVIGLLLLLEPINSKNPIIICCSLAALGTSSGFILSNSYTVPPLSKLLTCLEVCFNSLNTPALASEVLFFCTVLAYSCKSLGAITGALATNYSVYSIPYLLFTCLCIILSAFSKHYQAQEINSALKLIELSDL